MIVDLYLYCFEFVDRLVGFVSGVEYFKYVQVVYLRYYQLVWCVCDCWLVSLKLFNLVGICDLMQLLDVNFCVDYEWGCVFWMIDGEDYIKYFFLFNLSNFEFMLYSAVVEMDYVGVDMVLIYMDLMLGKDLDFLVECVWQYFD